MPSRLGSPNKKTLRLQELAEKYGVDPVEVQFMLMRDLKKTVDNEIGKPRSRRSKQFFEAQKQLCEIAKEVAPYVHSRRAAVEVSDETPRLTVITAPPKIADSKEWLEMYRPKSGDAAPALPPVLKPVVDTLDALDETDAVIAEINRKMMGN
jgi:hypothetical protein